MATKDKIVNLEDLKVVHDECSDLKSALKRTVEGELPILEIVKNEYVNASTGAFQSYSGWSRTNYIKVDDYESITLSMTPSSGYCALYDESKNFIKSFNVETTDTKLYIPLNAGYIALSNTTAGIATLSGAYKRKFVASVENLRDSLANSLTFGTNLFDKNGDLYSGYYDPDTRTLVDSSGWKMGDEIDVSAYNGYYLYANAPSYRIAVFRPNGNIYGVVTNCPYSSPFTLNDAHAKIRIAVPNAYVDSVVVTLSATLPNEAPTDGVYKTQLKEKAISLDLKKKLFDDIIADKYKSILEGGTTITPTENLDAIVGGIVDANRGNIYVTLEANNEDYFESRNTAFAELLEFNINKPYDVNAYEIVKEGDRINDPFYSAVSVACAWDTVCIKLNATTIRCITKAFWSESLNPISSVFVYRDFDITTKTFGDIYPCKAYHLDGTTQELMRYEKMLELAEEYELEEYSSTYSNKGMLLNTNIIDTGGKYYAMFSFENGTHCIMTSTDGANWSFFVDIPLGFPTEEVQLAYDRNYSTDLIFAVNRSPVATNPTVYIKKLRISTSSWIASKQLPLETYGGAERPAFEVFNNYGYVIIWGEGSKDYSEEIELYRANKKIYKVRLDNLAVEASIVARPTIPVVYPMLKRLGTALYIITCTDKRGYIFNGSDGRQELNINKFDTHLLDITANPFAKYEA